ncbi:MAG TPA: glycosyltransferase [Planctomycetota bacterium]|nr:glycosyltransferase [Planctomycetota bacterium]
MRLLVLTHRFQDPSFRVRWGRFLDVLGAEAREIPARGRRGVFRLAAEAETVVLHRRLLNAVDFGRLRRAARRLVYDFDDALPYRPVPPFRSALRERRFFRTVAGADLVLAGSGHLAGLARLRAKRVLVVPTSVEIPSAPQPPPLPVPTAVWIGQRATLPYLEPIVGTVRDAGFRLRVIADAAPQGAELVPWSLETEMARIAECHVGLAPLPSDPFARGKCGYKMLQYFAAGIACVASPVGAGRTIGSGVALLARDPAEWGAALRRLRDDPALRAELGRRGKDLVARRYDAKVVVERLSRILSATSTRSE